MLTSETLDTQMNLSLQHPCWDLVIQTWAYPQIIPYVDLQEPQETNPIPFCSEKPHCFSCLSGFMHEKQNSTHRVCLYTFRKIRLKSHYSTHFKIILVSFYWSIYFLYKANGNKKFALEECYRYGTLPVISMLCYRNVKNEIRYLKLFKTSYFHSRSWMWLETKWIMFSSSCSGCRFSCTIAIQSIAIFLFICTAHQNMILINGLFSVREL